MYILFGTDINEGLSIIHIFLISYLIDTGAATLCGCWPPAWFRNNKMFGVGLLTPRSTLDLKDQGLHSVWPPPFDLSGMGGSTRSLRSRQHSSLGH
jgi:hypothetical protein